MATLKDVQFSLNSEAVSAVAKRGGKDLSGIVIYDSKNPPKDEKEWVIFKLANTNHKGGVYLPSVDDVINPKTGEIERIRLLSGVKTIWQSEQKDLTKDYIDRNTRNVEFPRGHKIRRVSKNDKALLEFLRIGNGNLGNLNRIGGSRFEYYEYDAASAEKEAFLREEFELEMALAAKSAKLEPMRKHAAFLGIRLVTDLGDPKTEDGIRREYVIYAKRNPEYFKKTMENTEQVEVSWLVRKALAETLIDIGREPGKIFWANGGGVIGVYPQTENPQDYLTALAMTPTEEGAAFKNKLKQIVK